MNCHISEEERLAELYRLCSFNTSDELFDRAVRSIAHITDCPIALVSLIGARKQWFAARHGFSILQMRRQHAFCQHTIRYQGPFEVRDARMDRRFRHNPLVTRIGGIRYYAGVPLTTARGARIGALCVLDTQPRPAMEETRWRCFRSSSRAIVSALEQNVLLAA